VNDLPRATVIGSCDPHFHRVRDAFEANFASAGKSAQPSQFGSTATWPSTCGAVPPRSDAERLGDSTPRQHLLRLKALTRLCIHLLADRGEVDLYFPVADY
jgi:hypothetical protein